MPLVSFASSSSLFFPGHVAPRDLHSFPTRRSSDLPPLVSNRHRSLREGCGRSPAWTVLIARNSQTAPLATTSVHSPEHAARTRLFFKRRDDRRTQRSRHRLALLLSFSRSHAGLTLDRDRRMDRNAAPTAAGLDHVQLPVQLCAGLTGHHPLALFQQPGAGLGY